MLGQGQYGYKFHNPNLDQHTPLPAMRLHNHKQEAPTRNVINDMSSSPEQLPQQLLNGKLNQQGAILLALFGRLPEIIEVPVLDWAPSGLGVRFATLYTNTIWYMVESFTRGDNATIKLYTLLALYLPAIILHDDRATHKEIDQEKPELGQPIHQLLLSSAWH